MISLRGSRARERQEENFYIGNCCDPLTSQNRYRTTKKFPLCSTREAGIFYFWNGRTMVLASQLRPASVSSIPGIPRVSLRNGPLPPYSSLPSLPSPISRSGLTAIAYLVLALLAISFPITLGNDREEVLPEEVMWTLRDDAMRREKARFRGASMLEWRG